MQDEYQDAITLCPADVDCIASSYADQRGIDDDSCENKSSGFKFNTGPPAQWTQWGSWSGCSVTCGEGNRQRIRSCTGLGSCVGDSTNTDTCEIGKSHIFYSAYSVYTCLPFVG